MRLRYFSAHLNPVETAHAKKSFQTLQNIRKAIAETKAKNDYNKIAHRISSGLPVVIFASGNSAYPVEYCHWLLRRSGIVSLILTPLEYVLSAPGVDHICLLFSQGANHSDAGAIKTTCIRSKTPLFLVCDEAAPRKKTIAKELFSDCGRDHFLTTFTGKEKGFLKITGTAAAYLVAYEICAKINRDLPDSFPDLPIDPILKDAEAIPLPAHQKLIVLNGPAGRSAAAAFAGYHNESLSPVLPLRHEEFYSWCLELNCLFFS